MYSRREPQTRTPVMYRQATTGGADKPPPPAPLLSLPATPSPCALDIPGSVCSTPAAIGVIKSYIALEGGAVATDAAVVELAKARLGCGTEACVLRSDKVGDAAKTPVSKKALQQSLRRTKQEGPANSLDLLNNVNIDGVLSRLAGVHLDFYHMNFQMIDFEGEKDGAGGWRVVKGITVDPSDLGVVDVPRDVEGAGYKTFGVVVNTDRRWRGGIHWFALFCDFRSSPYTVEYFNSSGLKPVHQIDAWMTKTVNALTGAGFKATPVVLSGVQHQVETDSECGLYSLYYIWRRLNGFASSEFQAVRIPDALMTEFRRHCFAEK